MENLYTRKSKEKESANLFFSSLKDKFHYVLFTINFDDPKFKDADVFNLFNDRWLKFVNHYNRKAKRLYADPEAFYRYAMNRD